MDELESAVLSVQLHLFEWHWQNRAWIFQEEEGISQFFAHMRLTAFFKRRKAEKSPG